MISALFKGAESNNGLSLRRPTHGHPTICALTFWCTQNWQAYLKSLGFSKPVCDWSWPADIVLSRLWVCSVYLHYSYLWFGSATKSDRRKLQWTVRTAEKIIGALVPTLQDLCISKQAGGITSDRTHRPLPLWTIATKNWALEEHPSTSFFPLRQSTSWTIKTALWVSP